ncbi:chemotaxis protein CheX [Pelosinus sp. sgz500959]|uniref:chemotaxis protein CheX n=1 Tax=Pelosinus sp. sgz500959 TaxID=3242472 RepID=UPI00366FBCAB
MSSRFFAQYILNQGVLTPEQVQEALEDGRSVQVKLGVLAINEKFLTAVQVEEIHRLQHMVDKRFGEIAIDEGYLSEEQLMILLAAQKNSHLNFGQTLVDKGFMNLEQLERVLDEYKRESNLDQESDLAILKEGIRTQLNLSQEDEEVELYYDYILLFLRAIVRFLDASPLVIPTVHEQKQDQWSALQSMTGDVTLQSSFTADDKVLLELARRYSGEEIHEIDELALDSIGEFLNVTNGLFCINLSNAGLELDLHPQSVTKNADFLMKKNHTVTIDTGFGRINLVMARM